MTTWNERWRPDVAIIDDINKADCYGKTILHYASGNYVDFVVQELLDSGANSNARDFSGNVPLHYAIKRDSTDVVALLLQNGADPSAANVHGVTPLHEAAMREHEPIGRLLLDAGADIDARDKSGASPIFYATKARCSNLTKLLVSRGCEIDLEATVGRGENILCNTYLFCTEGALVRRIAVQQRQHRRLVNLALLLKPLDLPTLAVYTIYCSDAGNTSEETLSQHAAWRVVTPIKHHN